MNCNSIADDPDADLPDAYVTVYEHPGTPSTFGGAYGKRSTAEGMAKTSGRGRVVRYVPAACVDPATLAARDDMKRVELCGSSLVGDEAHHCMLEEGHAGAHCSPDGEVWATPARRVANG